MAQLFPFRAVRPTPDKVSLVTCRPYEEYSPGELAAYLEFNPFSFLHVLNPAYVSQHSASPEKRFRQVAQKYHDFKSEMFLMTEDEPALFLYEIQSKNRTYTGILGATSVEDYRNNVIKKHEDTLEYRVDLFKDYLHLTGFHTEPVLMTYPDSHDLTEWIKLHKSTRSLYEFSTTKREKHTLWKIDDAKDIAFLQKQFENIGSIYIADGHHRSASAEALYEQDHFDGNRNLDYFMSYLIPESEVSIYEFNRIVHDLNGFSKESFLKKLSEDFLIRYKGQEIWKPTKKFEFGMYLAGEFYSLSLKDARFKTINESLDAQILYDKVLRPLLGITDLRNDDRIDYIPGNKSVVAIKEVVDDGLYEVGFMLFPASISEIKALADNNLIMPPKSTYIEPKFRSGLIIYEL